MHGSADSSEAHVLPSEVKSDGRMTSPEDDGLEADDDRSHGLDESTLRISRHDRFQKEVRVCQSTLCESAREIMSVPKGVLVIVRTLINLCDHVPSNVS
jgi:hypothetical protein